MSVLRAAPVPERFHGRPRRTAHGPPPARGILPAPAHTTFSFGVPIKYVIRTGIGLARTVPISQW